MEFPLFPRAWDGVSQSLLPQPLITEVFLENSGAAFMVSENNSGEWVAECLWTFLHSQVHASP